MDFFTLYLIILISGLSPLFGVPAAFMLIVGAVLCIVILLFNEECSERYLNLCKWLIPTLLGVGFVMAAIATLIPSWEQMKFLIGGYYVTNIEGIETIPANMVDLINNFITEMQSEKPK